MTVSTTFGYLSQQDRIWLRCTAWPEPLWLSRRLSLRIVEQVARLLETQAPAANPAAATSERAAAAHDQALNRMTPGEKQRPLSTGREQLDQDELTHALLCTRCRVQSQGQSHQLMLSTEGGERTVKLSTTGLHRWLHGLHMMMVQANWFDGASAPDWLTRSYLPPALKSLLEKPIDPDLSLDSDDDA